MRLAWFTPWSPQVSGIAGRSADVTALLAVRGLGIDILVDERQVPNIPRSVDRPVERGERRLQSAHDFIWRHQRGHYDAVVYQVGNSRQHDFMWPYLFRWPGLAVLHDARLHHARARRLLHPGGAAAYRAEVAFNHPELTPNVAELAVHGFDGPYYAQWDMARAVVTSSRAVAVHTRGGAADLQREHPNRTIAYLPLGEGRSTPLSADSRAAIRRAHGAADDHVVFGVFGGLSADKRIAEILRAFAVVSRDNPAIRLWLAGRATLDVATLIRDLALTDVVTVIGVLGDDAFDHAIAATDVSINMRWPSAVETSGPWLRALAAARPAIVTELPHQAHVPAYDPRDWRPRPTAEQQAPVAVAVDILDEHHSLVLAMERLSKDDALRVDLGRAARKYWEREHTVDAMADGYIDLLRTLPAPTTADSLPESLRPDPWRLATELTRDFGVDRCELP